MPVAKSKRRTQPRRRGNAEQGRRLGRRYAGSNPAPQTACPERLHEYRALLMCTTVCWAYDLARVGKGQWCRFRAPGVLFGRCGGIDLEPSWGARELGSCACSCSPGFALWRPVVQILNPLELYCVGCRDDSLCVGSLLPGLAQRLKVVLLAETVCRGRN